MAKVSTAMVCESEVQWSFVRFGDLVANVKETVDRENTALSCYIAGEHMSTEDIHLRSWGELSDDYLGPAFHRRFENGQVLYGSRRTYLKKVAVASFDGITANTTFVLESLDEQKLLQRILPFIMLTDDFTEHSIRESKGSVNPYVNWKDIAKYKFHLPSIERQRVIVELLLTADVAYEKNLLVQRDIERFLNTKTREFLSRGWDKKKCHDVFRVDPRNGYSPKTNASETGCPTLSISAVRDGEIIPEGNLKYAEIAPADLEKFRLHPGDILVVRGNGNRLLCGKCGVVSTVPTDCFYPDLLIRVSFDPIQVDPRFAAIQWNEPSVHRKLLSRAQSTNGIWKINGKDVRQHGFTVPPLPDQEEFLESMVAPQQALAKVTANLVELFKMKKALANTLLSPPAKGGGA